MAKVSFKVSARAGKLLGRENFSNPEGALIELIKNSYDADAKVCLVIYDCPFSVVELKDGTKEQILDKSRSSVYIIDNGHGMSKTTIADHWMMIGTGNKETNFLSDDTRVKTGAKGIGRFALDRLGHTAEMWTVDKKKGTGLNWKMNWKQFDDSEKSISDITADLTDSTSNLQKLLLEEFSKNSEVLELINGIDFSSGTVLKVSGIKDDWFLPEIKSAFDSLEAMIPPRELNIPFSIHLKYLQKPKQFGKVETAFFNDYDYKVIAKYDAKNQKVNFELTRNELDLSLFKKKFAKLFKNKEAPLDVKTILNKTFKYSRSISSVLSRELDEKETKIFESVGSFDLSFYYLKYLVSRKEEYPYKSISGKERRAVLDKFGGVKIYRDSFRVRPYGDNEATDWLGLGSRKAKSPAGAGQRIGDWRVAPENTAGLISISRKTNPDLIDKSDRDGLVDNDSFQAFKEIIVAVIKDFEVDRSRVLNVFFEHLKKEKKKAEDREIQRRAEVLAAKMQAEREAAEAKAAGIQKKPDVKDLFEEERKEQGRKAAEKVAREEFKDFAKGFQDKSTEEVAQVRSLASLGLIMSSFGHELEKIKDDTADVDLLRKAIEALVPDGSKSTDQYKRVFKKTNVLEESYERIQYWVDYALTAIKKDKRKRKKLNVYKVLTDWQSRWDQVLENYKVNISVVNSIEKPYSFRGFEMDLDTILSNLINNSIDSFERRKKVAERNVTVDLKLNGNDLEIKYSDDGVGLSKVFGNRNDIFLPFTTSKKQGTGLGMYLVKSVVDDYYGSVEIINATKGFSLKITLPTRNK